MTVNFNALKKEVEYKFKPQSVKWGKALMVSYIDSRDVQDILDEACGPENWQDDYRVVNGNVYGGIGINTGTVDNPQWVWKWDCGTESNTEQEKGQASDAFKRAAVKWGVGRFLYNLGIVELPTKEYKGKEKPATHGGKILWNNDEISNYIRNDMKKESKGPGTSKDYNKSKNKNYTTPKSEPMYAKPVYSEETITKVSTLDVGGKKGKDALLHFLPAYNKEKGTSYTKIAELGTDELLGNLISFVESQPPSSI